MKINHSEKKEIEKIRQEVEKYLWEIYNPKYAPNMEEASEKIMEITHPTPNTKEKN